MTIGEARIETARRLEAAGVEDAASDTDWMLVELTGHSRAMLPLQREQELTGEQQERLAQQVARRIAGEPLQYILGTQDFMEFRFQVDARVLVPRPETELLCEMAVRVVDAGAETVLDLCCGSGCLGVSIAKLRPRAKVWATDISRDALDVAQANAQTLGAELNFLQGNLFESAQGLRFDMIVSNPPYVPSGDMAALAAEVRREPSLALDGGEDGLDFYRRIAMEASEYLLPDGCLLLEVGHDQAQHVAALCRAQGAETEISEDLRGIARFVKAQWREGSGDVRKAGTDNTKI